MAATAGAAKEGTAKAKVAEHISQSVQSTSNLLHLMRETSPSQALLAKLPKNLLAKASTIRNTEQVLEQMPRVIAMLDAYTESGLQSVPHLRTVIQLLPNIDSNKLSHASQGDHLEEPFTLANKSPGLKAAVVKVVTDGIVQQTSSKNIG